MEKFNPEVSVDYKKEDLKDPALQEIINGLDDSNEDANKIKQLDNVSLNNLSEIADRAEIALEAFVPSVTEYPEMTDEVISLIGKWEDINKKYSETTNINEQQELEKERKEISNRMMEIFDESL